LPEPYQLSIADALAEQGVTSEQGLTDAEARSRLEQYGPNALTERGGRSLWRILYEQLSATLILILIVAAVISAFLGDYEDAVVILGIVILNAWLGVHQELKAEKAMAALMRMSQPSVRVRRGGHVVNIESRSLVPGDIVLLEAGSIAPADARLVEAANLRMQEAALTGESEPVEKSADIVLEGEPGVGDRSNMVFRGSDAVYGRGVAVVVATGMQTELGRIAELIQGVEDEQTPLQKRLDRLGKVLGGLALAIVAVVFAAGLLRGEEVRLMFLTAVSLAVAAAPEGLPAVVAIALALGAQRMLARNALIRRLPAVETLGSVTVICSDKTGTLTQNRMAVRLIELPGREIAVEGDQTGADDDGARLLLAAAALCNDAVLEPDADGQPAALGDPTEGALIMAALHAGLDKRELDAQNPRIAEAPFDSNRKRMATLHELADEASFRQAASDLEGVPCAVFAKGAMDSLLEVSTHILIDGAAEPLDDQRRQDLHETHDRLAADGMRVLAYGYRAFAERPADTSIGGLEQEIVYIGLTGMIDPPRPEAAEAVARCESAGIRTLMITGDHPVTAAHIAKQLGVGGDGRLVTGAELEALSDEELEDVAAEAGVFARVSPEHKLRIVSALQRRGQVVAMTGDGVNDAPALKRADVGVAMGVTGSDVAREAADMVLRDDNFATIVAAVEEGRIIFDNIRKFIRYLLSANTGELLVMFAGPLLGMPLPLLPLQILWMNLVTDGPPALALSVEPAERNVMEREPFEPGESVFSRGIGREIVWGGALLGTVSLALGWWYWSQELPQWRTVIFTTLIFSQMMRALGTRSNSQSLFSMSVMSNWYLYAAVAGSTLLQLAVVYLPPAQRLFETVTLSGFDLAVCCAAASVNLAAVEVAKLLRRGKSV